jgi:phosphoribosylformylglycinamidine synthase
MPRGLGFEVVSSDEGIRPDAYWFGESQGRVVVSVDPSGVDAFQKYMQGSDVPCARLGAVSAEGISVSGEDWGSIPDWTKRYDTAIETYMQGYHTE